MNTEDIMEQDDYLDDGFDVDDSPNQDVINEIRMQDTPEVFKKVIGKIKDYAFIIFVVIVVVGSVIAGVQLLVEMSTSNADIGGLNLMEDMLRFGNVKR